MFRRLRSSKTPRFPPGSAASKPLSARPRLVFNCSSRKLKPDYSTCWPNGRGGGDPWKRRPPWRGNSPRFLLQAAADDRVHSYSLFFLCGECIRLTLARTRGAGGRATGRIGRPILHRRGSLRNYRFPRAALAGRDSRLSRPHGVVDVVATSDRHSLRG